MLKSIKNIWNENGFEIVLVGSLVVIGILAIFRIGKVGTWSTSYSYYNEGTKNVNSNSNYGGNRVVKKESSGERECRRVLQKIFNKPFNNCRPDFLLNPVTGGRYNLELDCYNELLKLAVEYNGVQHYKYNKMMHRSHDHFLNQKYRDDMKMRMCKDAGVNLVTVPYNVKNEDIRNFLVVELRKLGYLS